MNTIAHIAAIVALGWLTDYLYNTAAEPVLAFAALCIVVMFLPLTWLAILEDKEILS